MMFDVLLFGSLIVFSIGLCYKILSWLFATPICQEKSSGRAGAFLNGLFSSLSVQKIGNCIVSFVTQIILQKRLFQFDPLKGAIHLIMSACFVLLILMHAMDSLIMERFFTGYVSTLNPYFFLRDILGLGLLGGVGFALFRRKKKAWQKLRTSRSDLFVLYALAILVLSGFLLEGMKMASLTEFKVMVDEYAGLEYDEEDTVALEVYWVKDFALVSPRVTAEQVHDSEIIALGIDAHESYCLDCHSPNKSAFAGYTMAKILSPIALFLDGINGVSLFYYLHIIVCFAGLAILPFTKLFHMVATPISLITRSVAPEKMSMPNRLSRQLMELDACTHCCACNQLCSAGMMYESVQNEFVLPSEKMQALKKASAGNKKLSSDEFDTLFQGLYLCTNCDRCTVVCPSGIDLKKLWLNVRESFIQNSSSTPSLLLSTFSFARGLNQLEENSQEYKNPFETAYPAQMGSEAGESLAEDLNISQASLGFSSLLATTTTFFHCYGCQNCTTTCPVVKQYDTPEKEIGLMPHQIMYCLGLGLTKPVEQSKMAWHCLSCYQCQEHCPQNVGVCDILFALKNKAFNQSQRDT